MAKTQGSAVNEVRTRIRNKMETVKERKAQRDGALAARVKAMEELIAEISEAVAFVLEYVEASMDTEISVYEGEVGAEAKRRVEDMLAGRRVFLPSAVRPVDPVGAAVEGSPSAGDHGNGRHIDQGVGPEVAVGGKKR